MVILRSVISEMDEMSSVRSQIYTTVCVNLLTVSYGCSIGWLSPAMPLLRSSESPLKSGPISLEESSIIGSASCVGGFISSVIYGWLADKYGRKLSLISIAIPQIVGWILIYFAQNPVYLIFSRFLSGFAGGGIFIVIPLFITEISEDRIRGRLGAALIFSCNLGILISFVLGTIMDYDIIPLCLLMITNIFLAGVIVIHDSPLYLLKKSRFRHAEDALKFYRGYTKNVGEMNSKLRLEYDTLICLIKSANSDTTKNKLSLGDFLTKPAKKAIFIGVALMVLDLLSGVYALLTYASLIFDEAGSSLSSNVSAIIVGSIQVLGVYISTILVDRAGRKILMGSSAFCCALGLALFGVYDYLKHHGMDVTEYNWIPLASFSFVIFVANLGVVSLPFLVLTEVTPIKINGVIYTFNLSFSWFLAFIALQYLPTSIAMLGLYGTMFIFAITCLLGAIFIILYVPETKGRSIEEIQEIMAK